MSGNEAGALSQKLATTAGTTYTVRLLAAINAGCGSPSKRLSIEFGGLVISDTAISGPAAGNGMPWAPIVATGIASSSQTLLEIVSGESSACGPVISAVSVMAT